MQRLVPSSERGLSLFIVLFLVSLELLGRQMSSDIYDLVAGVALVSAGLFVLAWHRRYPLPWLMWANRLAGSALSRLDRLKYELGIDFRSEPPLPRKNPWVFKVALGVLAAWAGISLLVWETYADGWRALGIRTSYVLYLAGLVVLWSALSAAILAGIYLPVWVIDQHLKAGERDDGSGVDAVALVGYALMAVLVAWVTPPIYAVVVCLVVAAAAGVWYAGAHPGAASLVWRAGPDGTVYAIPLKRVLAAVIGLFALVIFDLLLAAGGSRLTTAPKLADSMPLTSLMASLTAWLVPGVVAVLAYQIWNMHRHEPSRVSPPTAHIQVGAFAADRWRANALVARWGWRTRLAPEPRAHGDVGLSLVAPEESQATEFDPRWPLAVSLDDLAAENVRERIERRDEIQVRRHIYRGVSRLLKQIKMLTPTPGGGYWIAPHWWFIETVQWEDPTRVKADDADMLRPIGPAFDSVFPVRSRQYLYRVLRTMQVDLIYLEDRISPRKVEKVLRSLFEVYDIHGGKRRAEDHHFQGIPKVRVMLHEYSPGNPFQAAEGYPEPKFDEVSRFRVLHIFRDRGEHEEPVEPPFDFSWEPAPFAMA